MTVTVSGGGFGTVVLTPSTSLTLESLAETTIWARASGAEEAGETTRDDDVNELRWSDLRDVCS